jgi:threonine synthase
MRYISTRGQSEPLTFSAAVETGLAPDGGLFLPDQWPDLRPHLERWSSLGYAELAAEFFSLFAPEIPLSEWHELTRAAYSSFRHADVAPLVPLDERTYVLELFHGPTLAFKDFALQLLGLLYKRQVKLTGKKLAILGATSGDTGSAAIHGCLGQEGITIFILYPDGRVAPLQERQMACTGADNVYAIPVPGTFDDAQRVVKQAFGEKDFAQRVNLSAVNSINIARILAQCVYYLWAWFRLPERARGAVEFVVPTGNFGNILAGWLVQQMGVYPQASFRVATNQNDILYRFFTTGDYTPSAVQPSLAPSMDIQAASNFERFLSFVVGHDAARVRELLRTITSGETFHLDLPPSTFRASRVTDAEIPGLIEQAWKKYDYVMDPHTACGFTALAGDKVSVVLATASPAKFPETVAQVTGHEPTDEILEQLKSRPLERHPLSADVGAVMAFMEKQLSR